MPRHAKASAAASLSTAALFSSQSAQAATLANATGGFSFTNFSRVPLFTDATGDTFTQTTGNGSEAIATADAVFEIFPTAEAANIIENSAFSPLADSSAFAESAATIVGDFFVGAGETFSFDFVGFIDLTTTTENPTDTASVFLQTQYSIFNQIPGETSGTTVLTELDFFNLLGQLSTPTGNDDFNIESSNAISINPFEVNGIAGPDEANESLSVLLTGRYERFFETETTLTLIELKQGNAFSENVGATAVPEYTSPLVWLLGAGILMMCRRRYQRDRYSN